MATDIVQSLFGLTPDAYQQAQQDRVDAQALAYAKLDPYEKASYSIGRGASGLASAVGGMLGGQDPQLQLLSNRQAIASQIDYNDPATISSALKQLAESGDTEGALQLRTIGQDMAVKQATIAKDRAAASASIFSSLPKETQDIQTMRSLGYPITTEGFTQYKVDQSKEPTPPSMVGEYTFAKTPEGGSFKGTFQEFVTARALAGRPPGQPAQPQPPVAVVDPVSGKQVLVSREEALSRRMTPAAAMESINPKEIQKREAAFPQATSSIKGFETKSAAFIKDLEDLRDSQGLDAITGIAAGRLPGITSSGRAAQALYDKITAKGGFQALQDMRDASKTGGALGNVSNQEGKQLTASFAAIDRRQDSGNVKAALNQAIADIQGSQTRMREAYDSTYSYKTVQPPTNILTNPKFPGFSIGKP